MSNDFFRINLPYGLKRNGNGQWMAFNREYAPIGWRSKQGNQNIHSASPYSELPVYARYDKLSEDILRSLASDADGVRYDSEGKIYMVYLYNDRSNPTNNSNQENWEIYFEKIKTLSELQWLNTPLTLFE